MLGTLNLDLNHDLGIRSLQWDTESYCLEDEELMVVYCLMCTFLTRGQRYSLYEKFDNSSH